MEITAEILTLATTWAPLLSLVLNIVLVFIVFSLMRNTPRSGEMKSTDQRIANVYKETEFEAAELMKDATEKAKRIIQEAALTKNSLDMRLEKSLGNMSDTLNDKILAKEEAIYAEFKKVFDAIAESYQNEGSNITNNFKEQGETALKTFIQTIHAEINSVREQIFTKIDSKMTTINEDLDKYRDQQYQKLDQNIKNLVKGTLETYLKQSLSSENHEQILFKALEKFKKETTTTSTPA